MQSNIRTKKQRRGGLQRDLGQLMKCLYAGEQLIKVDRMIPPSESLVAQDYSLSSCSSNFSNGERKPDTGNIEEAELSLRESSSLNHEVEPALYYAKYLLKLEGDSNIKGWLLLARILSAHKRFVDGENVLNATLDQTGKWDQQELLRTKAKLQIAWGHLKSAVETYSQLLALLQVQSKRL